MKRWQYDVQVTIDDLYEHGWDMQPAEEVASYVKRRLSQYWDEPERRRLSVTATRKEVAPSGIEARDINDRQFTIADRRDKPVLRALVIEGKVVVTGDDSNHMGTHDIGFVLEQFNKGTWRLVP